MPGRRAPRAGHRPPQQPRAPGPRPAGSADWLLGLGHADRAAHLVARVLRPLRPRSLGAAHVRDLARGPAPAGPRPGDGDHHPLGRGAHAARERVPDLPFRGRRAVDRRLRRHHVRPRWPACAHGRDLHRHHRTQAGRGGTRRERGALSLPVREQHRRRLPHRTRRRDPRGQPRGLPDLRHDRGGADWGGPVRGRRPVRSPARGRPGGAGPDRPVPRGVPLPAGGRDRLHRRARVGDLHRRGRSRQDDDDRPGHHRAEADGGSIAGDAGLPGQPDQLRERADHRLGPRVQDHPVQCRLRAPVGARRGRGDRQGPCHAVPRGEP